MVFPLPFPIRDSATAIAIAALLFLHCTQFFPYAPFFDSILTIALSTPCWKINLKAKAPVRKEYCDNYQFGIKRMRQLFTRKIPPGASAVAPYSQLRDERTPSDLINIGSVRDRAPPNDD
jgi:hypothetical protein